MRIGRFAKVLLIAAIAATVWAATRPSQTACEEIADKLTTASIANRAEHGGNFISQIIKIEQMSDWDGVIQCSGIAQERHGSGGLYFLEGIFSRGVLIRATGGSAGNGIPVHYEK